jgi:putative phosphoribosyl transferase
MTSFDRGKMRILSYSLELFQDRAEAGSLLAAQLLEYKNKQSVVLGIPRGGIVVAREVARSLNGELDVILSHKLRTPGESELAMGSVSENGYLFLNQDIVRGTRITRVEIESEKAEQLAEIQRRVKLFRAVRPKIPLSGRLVIIVDDGIATGATTHAAIQAVRAEKPQKLILAVPVAAEETLYHLVRDVDELICLKSPPGLMSVGQVYTRFEAVTDAEVLEILQTYQVKDLIR